MVLTFNGTAALQMSSPAMSGKITSKSRQLSPKGLIAFDLDGTVWSSRIDGRLTPRVAAAFNAAHKVGYVLTVATGRPLGELPIDFLNLPWMDWAICSSGAAVYRMKPFPQGLGISSVEGRMDLRNAKPVMSALLTYDQIKEIFDLTSHFEVSYWVDTPSGYFIDAKDLPPSFSEFHERVGRIVDSVKQVPELQNGAYKVSVHFANAKDRNDVQIAVEAEDGNFDVANEGEISLELSPKRTSKGAAALALCGLVGAKPGASFAFGDSGNDISFADTPLSFIAVSSAEKKVLDAADDVCPDVLHDGVAVWLERHVFNNAG